MRTDREKLAALERYAEIVVDTIGVDADDWQQGRLSVANTMLNVIRETEEF